MKLNPKQLAASAALLDVLACAAALPASAAGPVTTPLALTLPKVSFPWDKVTAESIETGSYDAAPLAGTAQQLSPVTTPANAASKKTLPVIVIGSRALKPLLSRSRAATVAERRLPAASSAPAIAAHHFGCGHFRPLPSPGCP